jgi:hypothetical protein
MFVAAAFSLLAQEDWKSFSNRAGWSIRYPANLQISSCRSCDDLTDPRVFVFFSDRAVKRWVRIEHLIDKPTQAVADEWLKDVSRTTVLVPAVSEEWITLGGERALRVRNGSRESASENVYVVHEGKTFAIRASSPDDLQFKNTWLGMLSSFRFRDQTR